MVEITERIEIPNSQIVDLEDRLDVRINEMNDYKRSALSQMREVRLLRRRLNMRNMPEVKNLLDALESRQGDSASYDWSYTLNNYIAESSHNLTRATGYYDEYKRRYLTYKKSVEKIEKDLSRLRETNPAKILTIEQVREQLRANPNVDLNRTKLFKSDNGGRPILQVCLNPVTCRPDFNNYVNIIDDTYTIRGSYLMMDLDTNLVYITRSSLRQPAPQGFTNGRRVHPHILSHDKPCLGDFLSSYMEAKEDLDINGMVGVLQLFLESTNPDDDAGKWWPRWAFYNARGARGNLNVLNATLSHRNGETGLRYWGHREYNGITIPVLEDGEVTVHKIASSELPGFLEHLLEKKSNKSQ